jgi:hypothetical protein
MERVAHGFAVMVLSAMACYGAKEVFGLLPALVTHPREAAWGLVFFVPFIYGLVRFVVGWRGYWGMQINDVMLALRAFWKMAAGLLGLKWLRWDVVKVMNQNGFWWGLGLLVGLTVALWWLLTGGVRFVLLTVGGSNALQKLLEYLKDKNRRAKAGKPTR